MEINQGSSHLWPLMGEEWHLETQIWDNYWCRMKILILDLPEKTTVRCLKMNHLLKLMVRKVGRK